MPKLIFDEAAMQIAMTKLSGRPIFAGPDGGLLSPGIVDLVEDDEGANVWQPGDERTRLFVLGKEACRDLVFHADRFASSETRPRTMKALTVPICSLMDVVAELIKSLNDPESRHARQGWPGHDQHTYKAIGKRFKKQRLRGPVRTIRNRIGAHLDAKAFEDRGRLQVDEILGAMGDTLILLKLAMNHRSHTCAWIRGHGMTADGQHRIAETMFGYPAAVCWLTDLEGNVQDVFVVRVAADPRWDIQQHLLAAIAAYNGMVAAAGCALPQIWTRPTEDLLKAEGRSAPSTTV